MQPRSSFPASNLMRILIKRRPTCTRIDGIQLDRFTPGMQYEVGTSLGAVFLSEGWAELVASEPAVIIPISELPNGSPPKVAPERHQLEPATTGDPEPAPDRGKRAMFKE